METTTCTAAQHFDPDLIARYDISGPRYTSYPAAPQFHARFGEADLCAIARASNGDPIPRPLSLYVHVPFCTDYRRA
jgi:oxygen-independent coproporphyrinogen-3 oxidase